VNSLEHAFGAGLPPNHYTGAQVALRAILIFFATLVIVRVANKRFFAKKTAFDFILGLILASMMARAINGAEPLIPTIAAGFLLAFLHRWMAWLSCHYPKVGQLIKGNSQTLVENGEVNEETMERHHIGPDDLAEELRLQGVMRPSQVQLARLERSGEVSVVKKE
jgi:uncharacterized membrane protein YcaP (DUF421 family)